LNTTERRQAEQSRKKSNTHISTVIFCSTTTNQIGYACNEKKHSLVSSRHANYRLHVAFQHTIRTNTRESREFQCSSASFSHILQEN